MDTILRAFAGGEDTDGRWAFVWQVLTQAAALADERARPLHPADETFAAGAIDAFRGEMEGGLLDLPVPELAHEAQALLLGALVDTYSGCLLNGLRAYGSQSGTERASAGTTNRQSLGERLAQHCREVVLAQIQELAGRAACLAPQPAADPPTPTGEDCPETPPLPPPPAPEEATPVPTAAPEVCYQVRSAGQPSPTATATQTGTCPGGWSGTWYDRRNSGQPWWPDLVLTFSGATVTGKFGADNFTGTLTGDTVRGSAGRYTLEIRLGWGGDTSGRLFGPLGCRNLAVKVDNNKWSLYELRSR